MTFYDAKIRTSMTDNFQIQEQVCHRTGALQTLSNEKPHSL